MEGRRNEEEEEGQVSKRRICPEVPVEWNLWQLLDSLLPTGGFAHSLGLESALHSGFVLNHVDAPHSRSLLSFATSMLESSGALLLPFVFAAAASPCGSLDREEREGKGEEREGKDGEEGIAGEVLRWETLDGLLHATLSNHVARRASVVQGTALLRAAAAIFPHLPRLQEMRKRLRASVAADMPPYGHYAPIFGTVCCLLGIDPMTTQRSFLFLALRDLASASTRLHVIGPLEAACLQQQLSLVGEAILQKYANRPICNAHQTIPLLDLVQGSHDHLFYRLFRS